MERRGYSLIEILFAIGLLALVTFLGLIYLRGATGRAGSHGLAMIVAEELRMARQEAITRRRPVALTFSTGDGATPACTGMALLEGETLPRISRSHGFVQEFPNCRIYVGLWPSGSAVTKNPVIPGDKYANFDPDRWLPDDSRKQDFCFIFMPNGVVRTNDLPLLGGAYHVVVASGLNFGASSPPPGPALVSPGPPYTSLIRTGECYTIDISPAGGVGMTSGLSLQDGSVPTQGSMDTLGAAPLPPTPQAMATLNPVLLFQPKIYPPQDPTLLPPNTDAVLTKDDFLSLETVAISPSGDPLYCNWNVFADPGNVVPGNDGNYSMQNAGGGGRMEWDPDYLQPDGVTRGAWRSVWQWRPPPDASPDDRFSLQCAVQNYGGAPQVAQIRKILVIPPGKVLFQTDRNGTDQLWSMNEDGSQQRIYQDNAYHPSATTNGSRIVFARAGDLFLAYRNDPSRIEQLTTGPAADSLPTISPNGNCIAFRRGNDLYVMKTKINATPVPIILNNPPPAPAVNEKMAWSPDGHKLLFDKAGAGPKDGEIWEASIDYNGGGGNPVVTGTSLVFATHDPSEGPLTGMTWGFDNQIYFTNDFNASPTGYDPYLFRRAYGAGVWNWWRSSYFIEECTPERDPGGGTWIMEVQRQIAAGQTYQIVKYDTATVPVGATLTPPAMTSAGNNTHPVWTR